MENYTREQVVEIVRSVNDPHYFIEKYLIKQPLTELQRSWIINGTQDNVDLGVERRTYRTSTMVAYGLWRSMFRSNHRTLMLAPQLQMTKTHSKLAYEMFDALPEWIRPKVTNKTASAIRFDNDSSLTFAPITEHVGCGLSLNLCMIDNMSMIKDRTEIMINLMPCFSKNRTFFMISQ